MHDKRTQSRSADALSIRQSYGACCFEYLTWMQTATSIGPDNRRFGRKLNGCDACSQPHA